MPTSQRPAGPVTQPTPKASSKLKGDAPESEAETSSSEDEEQGAGLQRPLHAAVTTRARAVQDSAPAVAPSRYSLIQQFANCMQQPH